MRIEVVVGVVDVGVVDIVMGDGVGSERGDVGRGRRERQGGARWTDPVAHSRAVEVVVGVVYLGVVDVVMGDGVGSEPRDGGHGR